jgi:hypothetical protein
MTDTVAQLRREATCFAMEARSLVDLYTSDDGEDTAQAVAALTPEAADDVLKKATARSGEHALDHAAIRRATK